MHMKRVTSPKFWRSGRKNFKWIFSPRPGPHAKNFSFPLTVVLRDVLGLVEDAREAKAAIKKRVLVDGVTRNDHNFPVGLMDVVSIPVMKKAYRAVPAKRGLEIVGIPEKEAKLKLVRVIGKQMVDSKVQLTTHDGRNFLGVDAKTSAS